MTDDPIVLRTPVLVVPSKQDPHKFVLITRVLSWLTGALMTIALVVALMSITAERNDLRDKLGKESQELVCRTVAAVDVTKTIAARDNTLSRALIAATSGEADELTRLIVELRQQTTAVDQAIKAEETSLLKCASL